MNWSRVLSPSLALTRPPPRRLSASSSTSCKRKVPQTQVQALIGRLPGAEALIKAQQNDGGGGFGMGGIMGAGTKMMAAGLSMGQVQAVTKETIAFAREKAGEDAIGEIVGAIPGLSQFV